MTGRGLRSGIWGLVALLAAIAAFAFVQPVVIASFGGATALDAIMSRIPPAFQAFARTRPEFLAMTGLPGYLSLGFTHPIYIVMSGAAVISFAARVLAGEMASGAIQLPLSRSVSRATVYLASVIGMTIVVALVAIAGPLGMLAGLRYAEPGPFPTSHLWPMTIVCFALFWAIAGISLLFSAAANNAGQVVGWALGLLLFSYFVDYFAGVWEPLRAILFLSLFEYFAPTTTLVNGIADVRSVVMLLLSGTLALIAGLIVFTQRDLPG
ncbi:MAG: ABC transporter permease [Chloroflexota bacterium]|nr:ABC transporter permease [Chloroflexota bacterium]